MNQTKSITDGALLTALYVVLLFISVFVPFIFVIGILLLPVPFIIYTARYSYPPAIMMLIAALTFTLLFATVLTLPLTLFVGIGGIVIGGQIYRGRTAYETWAHGAVSFVIAMVLNLLMLNFLFEINIYTEISLLIEQSLSLLRELVTQFNPSNVNEETLQIIEEQMHFYVDLLPVSIALLSIAQAFVAQWISYKIMNRTENKQLAFPPFKDFQLPTTVIFMYLLAFIGIFLENNAASNVYIASLNIFILVWTLLIIQGYSFIFFFFDWKKMNKTIPIFIVVVTIILSSIFIFIIHIIGMMDLALRLKTRLAKSEK